MPLTNIEAPGHKITGPDLGELRRAVAELLERPRNAHGFPGAQPVSFARRHLAELKRQDYYVCEKSDGFRYLLYLTTSPDQEEAQILIDRRNDYWMVPPQGLHFPTPNNVQGWHNGTLIDGELVLDRLPGGGGGAQAKYLVFDCMVLDGKSLMNRTLDKRLAYFKERIFRPYQDLLRQFPEEMPHLHFLVELKSMQFSYAVEMMFKQVLPELPHGTDGLIFTCRMTDYKSGTDPHILKWKPETENSIDFTLRLDFARREPDEHDRRAGVLQPYPDWDALPVCNLHVSAGDGREEPWFATMHLDEAEWAALKARGEPLQDRIVECYQDERKRWRYMRFRDDKRAANHTSTVDSVLESITDRVTEADLIAEAKEIRTQWKERQSREAAAKAGPEKQSVEVKKKSPDEAGPERASPRQGPRGSPQAAE